jgi:tRNA A-37 threonylcarbamoyl transferase component Bud32
MIPPLLSPDAAGTEQEVEICNIKDTIKYLRMSLSTRKLQKMKFNKNRIEKTMKILERLRYSGLKIPQIIDAVRRFVLPRLDYTMMNSITGTTELSNLDQYIRNIINEMIGGPALSKDLFYTANKNGGLGLRLLTER